MTADFPSEVLLPQKVLFRKGAVLDFARETADLGSRGLIVHGASLEKDGRREQILASFPDRRSLAFFCRKGGEPTLDEVTEVIEIARGAGAEWIAGIGGGSVLDLAKAAAGLFCAKRPPVHYQEGGRLEEKGIPFVAVPTTAGTGSEATPNAVIINPDKKAKLSIREKSFMACKILLDPDLLKGLPDAVMACSAMDAWGQGYESFISKNATWFTDVYALKSIELISRHLMTAIQTRSDETLAAILVGSYFAGVALAHARLGVIHGLAHPLGVLYHVPHGLVCSVCFVPSIQLNREAMGRKYDTMSRTIGQDLEQKVCKMIADLNLVSPFRGKPILEKEKMIEETLKSGSTAANPKPIGREDVEFLLKELF
ncbi:MAG: iron-containing alcohol dehydrogenase [Candidatus Omnitrophica bacterium]|nr:iron-containing alcohol dehydrogenase [Candidatus Omnitrophota bacterium]MDD5670287.1 iron-containing alcohol dehydrogenase [Candidatus Omnitrophota bacterium]